MRTSFYHPNPKHLRNIYKRGISKNESRDFKEIREVISFPALLQFAGMPKLRNQQCFAHKGDTGSSLSFYQRQNGEWMFYCNNAECGIKGDVIQFWFELLKHAGLYRADWSLPRAAGDLIERVESGEIDVSIREFGDQSQSQAHGHAPRGRDDYFVRLGQLVTQNKGREIGGSLALPKPIRMSVREAILGLFPDNGFLMITPKRDWHDIKRRDEWLEQYTSARPPVPERSFISSNYLRRADMNCSYDGMEGIVRRWMIIEGDRGTLEQQYWIHKQLPNLGCLCWSGGKSLHGWYFVEDWTERQCFDLYAQAIDLGISDCRTFIICQPVRLPSGWNQKTRQKQRVLVWH